MPTLCWLRGGQVGAGKHIIPGFKELLLIQRRREANSHGYDRSEQDQVLNSNTGLCQLRDTAVIGVHVKEVFPLIFVDHREARTSEEQ